jgi:O-antigen ligase
MARDFPLFGTGLGAFTAAFAPYQDKFVVGIVEHAHNDWLELAMQAGLLAAGVFMAGVAAFFVKTFGILRQGAGHGEFYAQAGIIMAALAFCLHGVVEFSFQMPANAMIFLTVILLITPQMAKD